MDLSQLESLVDKRQEELKMHRGDIRRAWWKFRGWFFIGPRAEIAHEVQVVNSFAERIKQRFSNDRNPSETDKANLVTLFALLKCAKEETDFAQAWSYVNLADAILPLLVEKDELTACASRLKAADHRLPDEYFNELNKHLIPEPVASLLRDVLAWMKTRGAQAKGKGKAKSKAESELQDRIKEMLAEKVRPWSIAETEAEQRQSLHTELLTRTLLWNGVNRRISLKLSLWASIRRGLGLALLALFAAIALWTASQKSPDWKQALSFFEIGLLGLFGGMLSAFLTARDEQVNVPSYQVVVSRTSLRMLLGAAGAMVMYSVGFLLLSEKLQTLIETHLFAFMTVGIVAGFSERLFIETLERAASNLHTSGSPTKEKDAGKTSRPAARRKDNSDNAKNNVPETKGKAPEQPNESASE